MPTDSPSFEDLQGKLATGHGIACVAEGDRDLGERRRFRQMASGSTSKDETVNGAGARGFGNSDRDVGDFGRCVGIWVGEPGAHGVVTFREGSGKDDLKGGAISGIDRAHLDRRVDDLVPGGIRHGKAPFRPDADVPGILDGAVDGGRLLVDRSVDRANLEGGSDIARHGDENGGSESVLDQESELLLPSERPRLFRQQRQRCTGPPGCPLERKR